MGPKTKQPQIQVNQVIQPQTWTDSKIEIFKKLDHVWYPNLVNDEVVTQKSNSNTNSATDMKNLNHSVE